MKLDWRTVGLTLAEPLRIARSTMSARDAVWLSLRHGGHTGHGEIITSVYRGLHRERIETLVADLAERVTTYPNPGRLRADLRRVVAGVPAGVAAGLDAAVHDLAARHDGVPVHALIGLPAREPPTARTIGLVEVGHAARQAAALAGAGFRVLKVKAGGDDTEDLARLAATRRAAPDAEIMVDPNGSWTAERVMELAPRLGELGVTALEQPLSPGDPEALAALGERSPIPVIADEDAATSEHVRALAGRVHGVNVKLPECGGIAPALEIARMLRGTGTRLMLGCMTASSLSIAPALHLASLAWWVDLDGHLLLARDPWTGIGGTDGVLRLCGDPGLGVRPAAIESTVDGDGRCGEVDGERAGEGERC